jgi:hypothetical protein
LLTAVLLLSFVVRIRLADAPLERDEGEHATLAQSMLAGNAPWKLAYNMKLPGTDAVYAVSMALLGQTALAIRLSLLLCNTLTIILVALLGKKLFGPQAGAVAGASYGLLALGQNVVGTTFHSTHLVALFAVIATLLLLRAGLSPGPLFLSGLAYGIAFLMKQPGLSFALFGTLYVVWRWWQTRTTFLKGLAALILFGMGCALPYALLCLGLWRAGVFGRFWFWTVTLAEAYATQGSFALAIAYLEDAIPKVTLPNLLLWLLAAVGLAMACGIRSTRRAGLFTAALLIFSCLAVSAGGVFNPNYFMMMFPAVALAVAAFSASGERLAEHMFAHRAAGAGGFARRASFLCCVLACFYSVAAQSRYLFAMTPYQFERNSYGLNPFPEAVRVAEYIRSHSEPDARIAVLGSEAEIYFYARRRPATGYLFAYGLMETHRYADSLQGEVIGEIEASRPEYIVFVGVAASWLPRSGSSQTILYWASDYTSRYYETVGVVEIPPRAPAQFIWGPQAASWKPRTVNYLTVFRRK